MHADSVLCVVCCEIVNCFRVVVLLIHQGGVTPVHAAAAGGHIDVLRVLLGDKKPSTSSEQTSASDTKASTNTQTEDSSEEFVDDLWQLFTGQVTRNSSIDVNTLVDDVWGLVACSLFVLINTSQYYLCTGWFDAYHGRVHQVPA